MGNKKCSCKNSQINIEETLCEWFKKYGMKGLIKILDKHKDDPIDPWFEYCCEYCNSSKNPPLYLKWSEKFIKRFEKQGYKLNEYGILIKENKSACKTQN